MHIHYIEDHNGNVVDIIPFCSDSCHLSYCAEHADLTYDGWNGCHGGGDAEEFCANCGVICGGYVCDCQRDNVVVNRFSRDDGEKCEHGNWIQLPTSFLVEPIT